MRPVPHPTRLPWILRWDLVMAQLALLVLLSPGVRLEPPLGSGTCVRAGRAFSNLGLPAPNVLYPRPVEGINSEICPQGSVCCSGMMNDWLRNRSQADLESAVRDRTKDLQLMFSNNHRSFNEYFASIIHQAEKDLSFNFLRMFGKIYTENAKIFSDLFHDLRRYYNGKGPPPEQFLSDFWQHLFERVFLLLNPKLVEDDALFECVNKRSEMIRPFGNVPNKLRSQLSRAIVAARTFVHALAIARDTVSHVSKVPLTEECVHAYAKMVYCPLCQDEPTLQACPAFCLNVLKGCLANHADLGPKWNDFIQSMLILHRQLEGPYHIDTVLHPIYIQISEAMMNIHTNAEEITKQVLEDCEHTQTTVPPVRQIRATRKRSDHRGNAHWSRRQTVASRPWLDSFERLRLWKEFQRSVKDIRGRLERAKYIWTNLSYSICSAEKIGSILFGKDRCWNGQKQGSYLPEVMGDGLANQINNPEVELDVMRPNPSVRQQIMALRIATNRLHSAYKGEDEDFQDNGDDGSGSGSGSGCLEDRCPLDEFTTEVPKARIEKISRISAQARNVPPSPALLLSAALLLICFLPAAC
uniref:glypican-6-like isoform X2 n=1 Tax=Myxine glutinosa TaxID=7769 RepID=UPI00358E7ED9